MVKNPFADRLALAARKLAYGEYLVISGPVIQSAKLKGEKVVLSFTEKGRGLMTGAVDEEFRVSESQATPANFELAGSDGSFVPAQAEIEGDTILICSDAVRTPVTARYVWKNNPDPAANLYNSEGLPASPFSITIEN
jgi:sialate O-acetylesterase